MNSFNVEATITSGQCFRFRNNGGVFTVYSGVDENVKSIQISQDTSETLFNNEYWSNFFDLQTDYKAIEKEFSSINPIMEEACAYAPGIRILNQNPWEALCSFVVSQNNNIKRIMGIVDRMCNSFGKTNAEGIHGFPCAQALANASEEDLRATGLGFRVPYIINVSRAVADGKINFDELRTSDISQARRILMNIKGIGPKVADCALLFGCHRLDCFPVDTWMKKVMETYFPGQDGTIFGRYAGVAQQYLFHWARTGEKFK